MAKRICFISNVPSKFSLLGVLAVLLCFCLPAAVHAQQKRVVIGIANTRKEPVPFASVGIRDARDTSHLVQQVSDSAGQVSFTGNLHQTYQVSVTSTGYYPLDQKITLNENQSVYTLTARPMNTSMGAVVITSKRPVLRQEEDKTIVDPETLAAASTNAYEILEKTPGLFVDQDGNVYLSSNTPATIYINGKDMKMSAADLATLLKSLPPGSVERIEILRTPSSKYDASGTGGIVNVVLKKGVSLGMTGSVSAGFNQGKYGNRFAGVTINTNHGKLSTYFTLQAQHRNNYEVLQTDRQYKVDSVLSQHSSTTYPANSYYLGYNIAYEFNKKWDGDYEARYVYNDISNASVNTSVLQAANGGMPGNGFESHVTNQGHSYFFGQGIDTRLKIDTSGSEWTNDISYIMTPGTNAQNYVNVYSGAPASGNGGTGTQDTHYGYFSGASDLRLKYPASLVVEAGVKVTATDFRNGTQYYTLSGNGKTPDLFRTSTFAYKENINAGYVQASKDFKGILLKLGTRLENTNMDGHQTIPMDTSFTLHRTDLFPYIYISRKIMKIAGYDLRAYLVYRRTITRPNYTFLNPFPHYIDPYLYETGNPTLRPQFTQNYEANISVDEHPLFAIGTNQTKDIFNQVTYQSAQNPAVAYRTYDNLGSNKEFYLRGMGAIPPGKKYFFLLGAQYNHNFYTGQYEGKPLTFDKGTWSFFTYQTLKLSALSQVVLNGFVRFNGQQQFYELTTFGALNLSVNRQFMKRKLVATLSATDLFFTNNNHFVLNQGSVHATGYREDDTRRFGLSLRYNFGLRKKEEKSNPFNMESPEKKE